MININLSKSLNSPQGQMNLEINLQITEGEFIALYGPSGAGKTSTLRMLAGLMTPDSGQVELDGKKWFDQSANISLKPQERNIGFVFQDYALFPNMTIQENLLFASKNRDQSFIIELISIMELGDLKNAYPEQLSGGQQQRVALARAVAQRPTLLLLDEPLSAVDSELRLKLQSYIKQIHDQYQLTTIMISHDQKEIMSLADRCLVLRDGKITKLGSPYQIFFGDLSQNEEGLTGTIVHIEIEKQSALLTIEIQQNLIRSKISITEAQKYKIGDKISFKSSR